MKFICRKRDEITETGEGNSIYLDINCDDCWIYRQPVFFYGLPNGILSKGEILSTVGDVLTFHEKKYSAEHSSHALQNIVHSDLYVKLHCFENKKVLNQNLTKSNVIAIGKKFQVCFEVWSKKLVRTKDTFKNIYTGEAKFKSNLIHCHYQPETESIFLIVDREKYMSNFFVVKI